MANDNGNFDFAALYVSMIDELAAHKVIMAHLYRCLEDLGFSTISSAICLKHQGQVDGIQTQLDLFANGLLGYMIDPPIIEIGKSLFF